LPLTRKPTGTRMGKGKGKLECWFTDVHAGIFFVEFKNLRIGRAKYFSTQIGHKLGICTKFFFNKHATLSFPFFKNLSFYFTLKW
jgi:ribosomal protein L16/L10AE